MLRGALTAAGVPHVTLPVHADVTLCTHPDGPLLHVLNAHGREELTVRVDGAADLAGAPLRKELTLAPYHGVILRVPATFTVADLGVGQP